MFSAFTAATNRSRIFLLGRRKPTVQPTSPSGSWLTRSLRPGTSCTPPPDETSVVPKLGKQAIQLSKLASHHATRHLVHAVVGAWKARYR